MELFPLNLTVKKFNLKKFYEKVLELEEEFEDFQGWMEDLTDLISKRIVVKRNVFKNTLKISKNLQIGIKAFNIVTKQKLP